MWAFLMSSPDTEGITMLLSLEVSKLCRLQYCYCKMPNIKSSKWNTVCNDSHFITTDQMIIHTQKVVLLYNQR